MLRNKIALLKESNNERAGKNKLESGKVNVRDEEGQSLKSNADDRQTEIWWVQSQKQ